MYATVAMILLPVPTYFLAYYVARTFIFPSFVLSFFVAGPRCLISWLVWWWLVVARVQLKRWAWS
mgnify:CR=1 FL=1